MTVDDESADWMESDLVGAGALVKRLNISCDTFDNWRKARKIVALRKGLRNFVYPLRLFERRRPVEGLDLRGCERGGRRVRLRVKIVTSGFRDGTAPAPSALQLR